MNSIYLHLFAFSPLFLSDDSLVCLFFQRTSSCVSYQRTMYIQKSTLLLHQQLHAPSGTQPCSQHLTKKKHHQDPRDPSCFIPVTILPETLRGTSILITNFRLTLLIVLLFLTFLFPLYFGFTLVHFLASWVEHIFSILFSGKCILKFKIFSAVLFSLKISLLFIYWLFWVFIAAMASL